MIFLRILSLIISIVNGLYIAKSNPLARHFLSISGVMLAEKATRSGQYSFSLGIENKSSFWLRLALIFYAHWNPFSTGMLRSQITASNCSFSTICNPSNPFCASLMFFKPRFSNICLRISSMKNSSFTIKIVHFSMNSSFSRKTFENRSSI
jgi:hypothetical protein